MPISLETLPAEFSVCRLDPGDAPPPWAMRGEFWAVTRTPEELSVIVESHLVPGGSRCESPFRAMKVAGPLEFSAIGIIAGLSSPLAEEGLSILTVSTFDTDYLLVRATDHSRAVRVLRAAGFLIDGR